jgi:hypothetical protein
MKKHCLMLILLAILSIGFVSTDAKAIPPPSFTVATFADPSQNSNNPLFTVDFTSLTLDGNWPDTKTGLTLQIPYNGHNFANAWFDVNGVITLSPIISGTFYGTGPGEINFYKDNTSANPLVVIDFDSGFVSPYGFGANEVLFTAANVRITGSEITGMLSQEQFSFSFANTVSLPGGHNGFTATAAFTSSAVPEPATIALLAVGTFAFLKRKRSSSKLPRL